MSPGTWRTLNKPQKNNNEQGWSTEGEITRDNCYVGVGKTNREVSRLFMCIFKKVCVSGMRPAWREWCVSLGNRGVISFLIGEPGNTRGTGLYSFPVFCPVAFSSPLHDACFLSVILWLLSTSLCFSKGEHWLFINDPGRCLLRVSVFMRVTADICTKIPCKIPPFEILSLMVKACLRVSRWDGTKKALTLFSLRLWSLWGHRYSGVLRLIHTSQSSSVLVRRHEEGAHSFFVAPVKPLRSPVLCFLTHDSY